MWFWVDPVASNETFNSLLLAPQAGLVIVPITPLPVTSTREKPMQIIVVVTGVTKMPGLLAGVVIRWKTPLDVMIPLLSPVVLQLPLMPRNSAVQPTKVSLTSPVVELP